MAVVHNSSVVGQKKASKRQEIRRSIRRSENHKNKSEPLSMTRLTPLNMIAAPGSSGPRCASQIAKIACHTKETRIWQPMGISRTVQRVRPLIEWSTD
jgi:hypothetical protein